MHVPFGGSNLWRTGLAALKIGATGFIVPYMFVYGPSLLLIGSPGKVVLTVISASIGVIVLSAGLMGWFFRETKSVERGLLLAASVLLIKPGLFTDGLGFVILASVFLVQKLRMKPA